MILKNPHQNESDEQEETGKIKPVTTSILNGCIKIQIFHLELPALVDTGASVSCINSKLLISLQRSYKITVYSIRLRVFVADGGVCHIKQAAQIQFTVAGKTFVHTFAVLNTLTRPLILGTDFFRKQRAHIIFDKDPAQAHKPIRAVRSVTVAPYSELALTGEVTCIHDLKDIEGVTDNMDRRVGVPFLVQRSLVRPKENNRHPIVILNTSPTPYRVHKGQILGIYTTACASDFAPFMGGATCISPTSDLHPDMRSPAPSERDSDEEWNLSDNEEDEEVHEVTSAAHDAQIDTELNTPPNTVLDEAGKERLEKLLHEYNDVFVGSDNKLGLTTMYEHSLHLKENTVPCHFLPYRMTPGKSQQFEQMCQDYVKQGILEETTEGPWASRSFMVQKSSGGMRLVTDFRYLNSHLINQALISPRADDTLEMIGDWRPKVFSKLDAQQGFFQIPIREEDRPLTAFLSTEKKYRYRVMPMGLKTSPQAFCALVTMILNKLKYRCAVPYMDDVLVLSQSVEDHFTDLKDVFESLRKGGLKLKKSKCEYFVDKIDFLGMIVTQKGIQPCPKKIEALKTFPRPKNVHEVRSFNGLCQFFKKFIKDFSKIIRPMYALTAKGTKFI